MSYFGYSQLARYKDCPKRYWYERIANRPEASRDQRNAFIGQVLGGVVARFYTQRQWTLGPKAGKAMVYAVHELAEAAEAIGDYPWQRGERQERIDQALAAIPVILKTIVDEELVGPRIEIELPVEVPLDTGDILTGTPDLLIEQASKRLILLDAKAGANIGKFVSADQLRLYQLGVSIHPRYGRLPDRVGFWWLRHGRIVWKRTQKPDLAKWIEGVKETIGRLRDGHFDPKPSTLCRYCPFRAECPAGLRQLAEIDTDLASDDAVGTISL